ncbi:hypothetical protein BGW37DRAFT_531640 [Umbelopsis sp. PMI_123]|nr:hypothetical protein BGW37DRAFT_531640 [Umbelopsis sp. PMI_123]
MFTGKDIPVDKRWYVIGAHQAGASERQCARLSGLSKTAVHGIIKAFTETGSPLSCRQQQTLHPSAKRKLSLDTTYDSIDLARRSSEDYEVVGICAEVFKRRRSSQHRETGQTVVHHTESKAHKPINEDERCTSESMGRTTILMSDQQIYTERAMSRPLTPPSDIETPKSDEDVPAEEALPADTKWSLKDDLILLEHVFQNHKAQWTVVERKLQKKHTAAVCNERWNCLKNKLLDSYSSSSARPAANKCNI